MKKSDVQRAARNLTPVLSGALLAAYLVTGSLERAEQAVLDAIEDWKPGQEPGERLIFKVIKAVAQANVAAEPQPIVADLDMADELKAVLRLDQKQRTCFVLRNLVGLTSQGCAQMLGLTPAQVDEWNITAFLDLSANRSDRHSARNQ